MGNKLGLKRNSLNRQLSNIGTDQSGAPAAVAVAARLGEVNGAGQKKSWKARRVLKRAKTGRSDMTAGQSMDAAGTER
jgi:hypothetical protein